MDLGIGDAFTSVVSAGACEGKSPICHTDGRPAEAVTVNRMSEISGAEKVDVAHVIITIIIVITIIIIIIIIIIVITVVSIKLWAFDRNKQLVSITYSWSIQKSIRTSDSPQGTFLSKRPHQLGGPLGVNTYSMNTGCSFPAGKADGGVKLATRQHFCHRG